MAQTPATKVDFVSGAVPARCAEWGCPKKPVAAIGSGKAPPRWLCMEHFDLELARMVKTMRAAGEQVFSRGS